MKVTIDTEVDNKESIRHAIKLLQAHIGDESSTILDNNSSSVSESTPTANADMFSMFGDTPSQATSETTSSSEETLVSTEENNESILDTNEEKSENSPSEEESEDSSDHKIEIVDL